VESRTGAISYQTIQEIDVGIDRLTRRLDQLRALEDSGEPPNSIAFELAARDVRNTIRDVFGQTSSEYQDNLDLEIRTARRVIGGSRPRVVPEQDRIPEVMAVLRSLDGCRSDAPN
jgi:hypothetical protein